MNFEKNFMFKKNFKLFLKDKHMQCGHHAMTDNFFR